MYVDINVRFNRIDADSEWVVDEVQELLKKSKCTGYVQVVAKDPCNCSTTKVPKRTRTACKLFSEADV